MDFYFQNDQSLDLGTPARKFENNLVAIRLAKELAACGRAASPDEQAVLSYYVGWGDSALLRQLNGSKELDQLLTTEEQRAARASSLNAHYTALPVIGALWSALAHLGFGAQPFRVLDPSAGVGHFKSVMPVALRAQADWTEIELDALTASILRLLHPESRVFAQGYETANLPEGWFDLAISNIPFGDYGVAKRALPGYLRKSIHDFFFANTVSLLKPGGILAFITSRYTLDKKDVSVRTWLARRLDLLAAVRLPNSAFKANAGTEVVTDILVMQKRAEDSQELPAWVETDFFTHGYRSARVNRHFLDHPHMLMGSPSLDGTMYKSDGYTVESDGRNLGEAITEALCSVLPENILAETEKTESEEVQPRREIPVSLSSPNPVDQERVDGLKAIYLAAKKLLAAETQGRSVVETSQLRYALNQAYDDFASKYGPINKPANIRLLGGSFEAPFLRALEEYNATSVTAKKAGLFSAPMVRSTAQVESPSVEDALLVCLDQTGKVDLPTIAHLCGGGVNHVTGDLKGRIFRLPDGSGWVMADEYLSGNVREKLRAAQAVFAFDEAFQENVAALESVIPLDLKPGEIRAPLGAGWIPTEVVVAFLQHLLTDGEYSVHYIPHLAHWEIEASYQWRVPDSISKGRWGTPRASALELITSGLNAKTVTIYDEFTDNGNSVRVVNQTETVAAQAKLSEIKTEFERWLWSDSERAAQLCEIYNERFNAYRVREYDGAHLSTPGLNRDITLRPHQKNAVWRILQNSSVLLHHEVGMGKTLAAIVAAMEAKRLGFARKALVVVPNHLTSQWHVSTLAAYPGANILAPSPSDLSKARRGEFLSRVAANDWDIIIVPFSSFKLLPVSSDTLADFYQREIDTLYEYLQELKAQEGKSFTRAVKEIEKSIKRFQVKLDNLADMPKDNAGTITFEELGVDMLIVDEFHCLPYESRVLTDLGLIPIGEIVENRLPVLVKSVDLSTNEIKWMPVTGWFINPQSAPMVRIEHEGGVFECTANHKVWTEEVGYVEAGKLTERHTLKNLPDVQATIHAEQQRKTRAKAGSLFSRMPKERQTQNCDKAVSAMRKRVYVPVIRREKQRQEKAVWKLLCGEMAYVATRTPRVSKSASLARFSNRKCSTQGQTESCSISPHESKQPQSDRRVEKKNVGNHVWSHIPCSRRERETNPTTGIGSKCFEFADGVRYPNWASKRALQVATKLLQSGHSRSNPNVSHRDRWGYTQNEEVAVFGSAEDRGAQCSRVVRVTVLESESGFRSSRSSQGDKRVYCLEVAETHNFFAEGVLVSNCYKNLYFPTRMTRIAGLTNSDSQRAFDMFVKFSWLHEHGGKVIGLTGTPVTNTLAELFTMQRYFQLETLQALGISHFDAWANQFALAEPGLEMTPDGSGFRMNTRFRKFVNVPELMKIWFQVVDAKRIDDRSGIQRPDLLNGKPVKVLSDGGPELLDYVSMLAARAEKIRARLVQPHEDNMLCVTSDGRKAALDLSLVIPAPDGAPMPKIDALVEVVADIFEATAPVQGTQIVFCDLATPKAKS